MAVVAAVAAAALVARQLAVYALYVLGVLLMVVGAASGVGAGVPEALPGMEREAVRVFRADMQHRIARQFQNVLVIAAGAALVGLGVLLELA